MRLLSLILMDYMCKLCSLYLVRENLKRNSEPISLQRRGDKLKLRNYISCDGYTCLWKWSTFMMNNRFNTKGCSFGFDILFKNFTYHIINYHVSHYNGENRWINHSKQSRMFP